MRLWFNKVPEPKVTKNRVHIDINLPDEGDIGRLLGLGAHALRAIRDDDGTLWWTIMADPEGNEFCAFPPPRDWGPCANAYPPGGNRDVVQAGDELP